MTNDQLERLIAAVKKPSEMTLLDYFAGQALANIASSTYRIADVDHEKCVVKCYDLAEAMLAEKEKRKK